MSISLALADAAKNCATVADAEAVLTLRSGVEIVGQLTDSRIGAATVHVTRPEGWTTVRVGEIAAVTARLRDA